MNTKTAIVSFFAAGILFACGSPNNDDPVHLGVDGGASTAVEQDKGACPSHPHAPFGTATSGASCGNATDCAPVCCPCATGASSWTAAACVNGACADAKTACGQSSDDAQYCK